MLIAENWIQRIAMELEKNPEEIRVRKVAVFASILCSEVSRLCVLHIISLLSTFHPAYLFMNILVIKVYTICSNFICSNFVLL